MSHEGYLEMKMAFRVKDNNKDADSKDSHASNGFPRFRHYFRLMVCASGRLHTAADQTTGRADYLAARTSHPPVSTTIIQLPGHQHWHNVQPAPSAQTFSTIGKQWPVQGTERYLLVNFKHDIFCFVNANPFDPTGNVLNYFQNTGADPGSFFDPAHWFYRIEHLVLITSAKTGLGALDRRLLAGARWLKTVIVTVPLAALRCIHLQQPTATVKSDTAVASPQHVPLATYSQFATTLDRCDCGCFHLESRVEALEAFKKELVVLFRQQAGKHSGSWGTARLVPEVRVEVEMTRDELAGFCGPPMQIPQSADRHQFSVVPTLARPSSELSHTPSLNAVRDDPPSTATPIACSTPTPVPRRAPSRRAARIQAARTQAARTQAARTQVARIQAARIHAAKRQWAEWCALHAVEKEAGDDEMLESLVESWDCLEGKSVMKLSTQQAGADHTHRE